MKFLIVDEVHDSLLPLLVEIGITGHYCPEITRQEIINRIIDYDGLVIRSKTLVDQELLANANNLKYVCRAGAGIDNLDEKYIEKRGIKIINAPEGNRNAVAEHCMGLLFSLLNNIVTSDRQVRSGKWDREGNRGHEITNKTVGIIGFGNMGKAFANKLKNFNCKIIAYDKYKKGYGTDIINEVTLDQLYNEADVVSLHIPLTEVSNKFVNETFFKSFEKPIWIINTSRGGILDIKSLINNLENGKVNAAALDVLENEKFDTFTESQKKDFEYLSKSDKVILTPHIAGWSFESYELINKVLVNKLKIEFQ
jgi:D-3-phosphoglycerate dehydrogenase